MITINLKMDDDSVQTHINGKMYVSDVIAMTNAFCNTMIELLQDAGMSEHDAQCVITAAALSGSEILDES